jgi:ABC-2 type transport system ATP-binding protein
MEMARGSIVGLLGPSGCGKTTLTRVLLGTQTGVTGGISVLGRRPGAAVLRRRVAAVPQTASVYDELSVQRNLAYFAAVLQAPAGAVERVLEYVDLSAVRARPAGELSGGQRNRVSLAVALLGEPQLLILDEPTVGLDPVIRRSLWALFRSIADGGTTILVTSHAMDEAAYCDRILLLREGRLISDSTAPELLARTRTASVEDAFIRLIA